MEWNVRVAWLEDVVKKFDFKENNLFYFSYSKSINKVVLITKC